MLLLTESSALPSDQEVEALYRENDMLRYAIFRELEGHALSSREELSQLAADVGLTIGGGWRRFDSLISAAGI